MSSQPPWTETDEHPRDVFDDVPEDGPRQGAHRPVGAAEPRTPAGLKAMVVVGSLGLLLGAGAYVGSTVTDDRGLEARSEPTAQASSQTTASASPEPTETAAATTAPEDAEQVGVFNATALDGVAGAAGSELTELDWEIIATGNWGLPLEESVVYYAEDGVTGDTEEQAQGIADALGIQQIQADDAAAYPLVAVIGDDIAQELLERSGDQAASAQTAPAPSDPAQTGADQDAATAPPQDPAEAPADDLLQDSGAPGDEDGADQQPAEQAPAAPADPAAPVDPAAPADPAAPVAPAVPPEQIPGAQAPADASGAQ